MTANPQRSMPAPLGWADHRTRTVALNGWLAREDAVAAGTVAALDPQLLGLPDRETLLRSLFQRWTTTLEGVLDNSLEEGPEDPAPAVRSAFHRAAAHRPGDWRALVREGSDPVIAELTRRQYARIARRAGISVGAVAKVATATAAVGHVPGQLPRARRRGSLSRVLIRRAAV
jgi:hypothetical protein